MPYQFTNAIIAGTFDHLHSGHKKFIAAAFEASKHVHISISKQTLTTKKEYARSIQPYNTRKESLVTYLIQQGFFDRATIYPLYDIYGMAVQENACEAIFVTNDTKPNAMLINKKREKQHCPR